MAMSSIFSEKLVKPDNKQLAYAIGKTQKILNKILEFLNTNYSEIRTEWKFYGQKYGWQMKIFYKKRNILFLIPYEGYFKIVMFFGDKAVAAIIESDVPESIVQELLNAKKYMEGRGIGIDVKEDKDFNIIKELIKIKLKLRRYICRKKT